MEIFYDSCLCSEFLLSIYIVAEVNSLIILFSGLAGWGAIVSNDFACVLFVCCVGQRHPFSLRLGSLDGVR